MGLPSIGFKLGKMAYPAIGGAIGGLGGAIGSAFDGDDGDGFKDTITGAGMGMLTGGLGGLGLGLGGKLAGPGLKGLGSKAAYGGAGLMGLATLGGGIGNALDVGDEQEDATAPKMLGSGVLQTAAQARGGSLSLSDNMGAAQDFPSFLMEGDPAAPDISLPSLSELTMAPDVQKAANQQIIASNAATMREIKGIKKRRDIELQQNEQLSAEFQRRSDEIEGGNVASTKAITDHHASREAAIDAETAAMHEGTGAALAGNEYTRAQHASQMDTDTARLNEARVADNALLERLGLGTSTILQDMAAVEASNTQNELVNIRSEAADEIDVKNTETADRWRFDKPNLLNALAKEQMQSIKDQRQMGLQMYQTKLQQAGSRRQDMLSYLNNQQNAQLQREGMAMQYGGPQEMIPPEKLYGASGQTFKNPVDDSTQSVPMYATLPEEIIAQQYPHLHQSWQQWQAATKSAMGG